ncbi:hypothetical protein ACWGDT_13805 [Streptomyces avermitilis]
MKYFNKTGWTAYFTGIEGGDMARMRHVESWDPETGVALIVDPGTGCLRPVTSYEDFCRLERAGRIVGVLPGGGWQAFWEEDDDDAPFQQDVLGWLVTDAGSAMPFVVTADGSVEVAESADKLISPNESLSRRDTGSRDS